MFDSLQRQVDYYVKYIGEFLQSILSLSKNVKGLLSLKLKTKFVPVSIYDVHILAGSHK